MLISKYFAKLGFQVEEKGLVEFNKGILSAKKEVKNFTNNVTTLDSKLKGLNTTLGKIRSNITLKINTAKISKDLEKFSTEAKEASKALKSISATQPRLTRALESIHREVSTGTTLWREYRREVERANRSLGGTRGGGVNHPNRGNGGSSSNERGFGGNGSIAPQLIGGLAGGNIFNSARQAVIGGLGYASPFIAGAFAKNVIHKGRELRSADQVLLAHSSNQSEYEGNREFVGDLSNRLGVDLTESIRGFGRVLSATRAGGGTVDQAQSVFKSVSEYATTMHLSQDEQKRLIKALEQTYTNQRILGGEINQFANVGVPMKAILKEISNGKLGGSSKEKVPDWVRKLADSKAPNTVKLMPYIAKYLENTAHHNGALDRAMDSSQAWQGRFNNRFQELSYNIMENGGDEALANFFKMLTKIVDEVEKLRVALKSLNDFFDGMTNGSSSLAWGVLLLLSVFTRFRLGLGRTATPIKYLVTNFKLLRRGLSRTGGIFKTFANFIKAPFSNPLLRLAGRFFYLITVIQLLISVGTALNKSANGQTTWIDVWVAKIKYLMVVLSSYYYLAKMSAKETGRMGTLGLYDDRDKETQNREGWFGSVKKGATNFVSEVKEHGIGKTLLAHSLVGDGIMKTYQMKSAFSTPPTREKALNDAEKAKEEADAKKYSSSSDNTSQSIVIPVYVNGELKEANAYDPIRNNAQIESRALG